MELQLTAKKGVSETFRLELPLENTVSPMHPILMNLQECHLIDLCWSFLMARLMVQ